jgi:tetratricopeptide (TPR) repeat protein
MGFSPNQARTALASTESGLDVQAALEKLLSDASEPSPTSPEQTASGGPQRQRDRLRDYDGQSDDQHDTSSQPRPRHQPHPSLERSPPSSSETQYQQQADKIITQAGEIGSQLFQRANAFWKVGKSRVQKAYEERAVSSRGSTNGNSEGQNGRPRWMQEDSDESQPAERKERSRTNFRDEETDADSTQPEPPTRLNLRPQAPPNQSKTADLFGEDSFTAYVSPFRRGTSSQTALPSSSVPAQTGPLRTPSPIRLSERPVISASPSAVSASAQHKASGTEMFKLGRFAEAEAAYTLAISQLPDSHLLLVPLLNNRGLSRLKTGNVSGAIEDCTTVIAIVGPSYHPAREAKVAREEDGAGVDLGDGLIKAWRRRAEAYEGKEKWDLARQDWESIAGADFAGRHRSEALSGIGRCRKVQNVDNTLDGTAAAAPSVPRANAPTRPTTRPPPRRGRTPPSEALTRLKQANQEAEAEEQARMELKDSVDSRLAAWKNGKETNLRALVASLDTVLWPELGWQKVGMAELVTPNQVKIRYTKAIAKLHPDKVRSFLISPDDAPTDSCWFLQLNVKNTTVEQRMVANGVFGALNDAWNAFKP